MPGETSRVRAHAEAQVLQILAELQRPEIERDPERLMLLRTEVREALVDPALDCACQTCLEPLSGPGRCDWCGAR